MSPSQEWACAMHPGSTCPWPRLSVEGQGHSTQNTHIWNSGNFSFLKEFCIHQPICSNFSWDLCFGCYIPLWLWDFLGVNCTPGRVCLVSICSCVWSMPRNSLLLETCQETSRGLSWCFHSPYLHMASDPATCLLTSLCCLGHLGLQQAAFVNTCEQFWRGFSYVIWGPVFKASE